MGSSRGVLSAGTLSTTPTLINVMVPALLTTPEMVVTSPGATGSAGQCLVTVIRAVLVTVTVNVHLLVLPLASVAVLVTVVVPNGNVLPLGGVLNRFVTLQLSV